MRVDYFHGSGPGRRERSRSTASSTTARGRAAARSSSTRPTWAITCSRSREDVGALLYSRGFCVGVRRVGDDRRAEERPPHVPRVAAVSVAAPDRWSSLSRDGSRTTASRRCGRLRSIRRRASSTGLRCGSRRARSGRCSRTVRRPRRSTCSSSARATPPPRCRSSMPTCSGCCRRSSTKSRSRAGGRTSTSARWTCPSAESGVNRPNAGVFRRTPLSAEYNIFDSERYVLTLDNRALRDAASAAPYEFIEILVNDKTYGGGGIFNDQATASVDSAFSPYVFVHEFGHHFAALADEYYTSDVAYEPGAAARPEPWEPNVTALQDPAQPEVAGSRRRRARRCRRRGTRTAFEQHTAGIQNDGARSARATRPKRRWTRSSGSSATGTSQFLRLDEVLGTGSARSKAPRTRRTGSTGPRPIASCSRAMRSGSAACAAARSGGSSTSTRE